MVIEVRVTQVMMQGIEGALEAGKGTDRFSSRASRRTTVPQTHFRPLTSRIFCNNGVAYKPLHLRQFVTAEIGN